MRTEMTPPDLPIPDVRFLLVAGLIQFPLMIGLPIALAWFARRRLGVPLWVVALGMAGFVGSQIVHLPLNYALGLLGREGWLSHAPLPILTIAVGLSAGLCEELARYGIMRAMAHKQNGWPVAIAYGVGHGGGEALIFGLLALANTVAMALLSRLGELAQRPEVQAAAWSFWSTPWYTPAFAGWERLSAILAHLGMSVLVMRAVTRRNPLYLVAAIGAHTLLDALILPLRAAQVGVFWTELIVFVVGCVLAAVALGMREQAATTRPSRA